MKILRSLVVLLLTISGLQSISSSAFAEECPVIDYTKLSFGTAVPVANWKNNESVRVITWDSNASSIPTDQVSKAFSQTEQAWLQQAFDNYGEILDSIAFQKVDAQTNANIVIGYTLLSQGKIPTETTGGNFGLWKFVPSMQKAGIQLLDSSLWPRNFKYFKSESTFILPIENEIGNVLGVPDVDPFGPRQSLISIYDTGKLDTYGQTKINDYDAAIVRQLYGESTCASKYTADARAKNLAADKIAGQQYLVKAGLAPSPTPIASPKTITKTTTITCVKGSTTKKVTAVKPTCPSGYKKK